MKYSLNPENLFESACLEMIDSANAAGSNTSMQTSNSQLSQNIKQNFGNKSNIDSHETKDSQSESKKISPPIQNSSIDRIWGNVLLKVKELNLFALSNALTSVNKVEELGHKLIIHTNDSSSYEMIDNRDRIDVILKVVKLFDDSIEGVEIEYDRENASKQDVKDNLKEVFKTKIKFKE